MLIENGKLLLGLLVAPRRVMGVILDEGSVLFGAAAVLLLSLLMQAAVGGMLLAAVERQWRSASATAAGAEAGGTAEADETGTDPRPQAIAPHRAPPGVPGPAALLGNLAMAGSFGAVSFTAGLVLLYVPALVLVTTMLERRAGSFGVALRRDYGGLAACTLIACAAAELLCLALTLLLAVPMHGAQATLVSAPLCAAYFGVLLLFALRTVYGVRFRVAAATVVLASLVMPLFSCLGAIASPFVLFWLYMMFRGDIGAIESALGSRRSFKRHLEAATLNPRDSEAHYQLGLIHQQRRQHAEAIARFQKAIEIDDTEIDAHYQLGRIAREQQRWGEAIRHFEAVAVQDPKHSRHEVWREAGATYLEASDFTNARNMLERYVLNRPYDPEGLFLLGLACKRLGDGERARSLFERCIESSRTAPDFRRSELRHWRRRAEAEL